MKLFYESEKQIAVTSLVRALQQLPQIECPVKHHFTPGIYAREIFMPAGSFVVSEIHKTEHPYIISQGIVDVWIEETGTKRLYSPHFGITKPNTRRMLHVIEDCIWTTFHATQLTDVEQIKQAIIVPFESLPYTEQEINFMESFKLCHGQS